MQHRIIRVLSFAASFIESIFKKLDRDGCAQTSFRPINTCIWWDEIGLKLETIIGKAGSFLIKECSRNVISSKYLWLQFISLTEVPISRREGQTCRSKYSGEIFGENMQERGILSGEKSSEKYVGDFRGGIQQAGILQHTCLVFVRSTFSTNCLPKVILFKRQPWDNPGLD